MTIVALILALLMYIFMIVMNALANTLPLNGINTGAVSFQYPNLFQPSGITFSIWGVIYLLLFIYLIYQFVNLKNPLDDQMKQIWIRINLLFALTSLLNGLWLFAWHYDQMILSTIIMIGLLITLIFVVKASASTSLITRAAFSVYLGWITIATIANITITLVKLRVPSFNTLAIVLTVAVLIVGATISLLWIIREKDYFFGFVIIWAYVGIAIRHLKAENITQMVPAIYITVLISILCLIIANGVILFRSLQ